MDILFSQTYGPIYNPMNSLISDRRTNIYALPMKKTVRNNTVQFDLPIGKQPAISTHSMLVSAGVRILQLCPNLSPTFPVPLTQCLHITNTQLLICVYKLPIYSAKYSNEDLFYE